MAEESNIADPLIAAIIDVASFMAPNKLIDYASGRRMKFSIPDGGIAGVSLGVRLVDWWWGDYFKLTKNQRLALIAAANLAGTTVLQTLLDKGFMTSLMRNIIKNGVFLGTRFIANKTVVPVMYH